MNNIKIPIMVLIVAVLAFGVWLLFVHQAASATPPAPQQQVATGNTDTATTTSAAIQTTQPQNVLPALSEAAVASAIPGHWQSTDDPNYSVDITSNGRWTDSYKQGSATSTIAETGTYTLFTSANPDPDFPGPAAQGVVYIKLIEGTATYFYSVIEATNGNLQLSYLARGNTLSFVKAQ